MQKFYLYLCDLMPIILGVVQKKTIIIYVKPNFIYSILKILKQHIQTQFSVLTTISVVDYPYRNCRFEIVYELLSVRFNYRLRVKTIVDELFITPSVIKVYPAASWMEREAWDLFGTFFDNNASLKRILTDYGFEGHPLRKDFPVSGYVETRYNEKLGRVVCEPLEHAQEFRNFNFSLNWIKQ